MQNIINMMRWFIAISFVLFSSYVYAEKKNLTNIPFAKVGERLLTLDLYLPAEVKSPYLIVWVHGGAWRGGSKANPPKDLLARGFALASVEYRLSTEARFPAQIHDIKAAIRFLRAKAKKYGYREDKIAVWGSSAGGHLAALIGVSNNHVTLEGNLGAYTNVSSSVQATIDYYGPTNFLSILNQSTPHGVSVRAPALKLLLGNSPDQVEDLAKLASPVYLVDKDDPPMLIMHGDQDVQVPINQSHELEGRYQAVGAKAKLIVIHGAGHSSPDYFSKNYIDIAESFLNTVFN